MTRLHIINGPMKGRDFGLEKEITLIGRSKDSDIQIRDRSISKKHAKIHKKADKFFIEDQYSRNGTQILGGRIKPGDLFELEDGIPITMGNIIMSLGNEYSVDGMVSQYSIKLSDKMALGDKNPLYKDRRITNRRNLEVMYEASTILMQTLDINEICDKIMEVVFTHFKRISSGAILLVDDKTRRLKVITARSKKSKKKAKTNYSRTIVNRVIREGKAVIMSDTSREDKNALSESIEMMRIKSIMCVPLISKSETRGVIYVHSINVAPGFRKDDLILLTVLSSPAALAIENALLYARRKHEEQELMKTKKIESIGILAGGIAHDYNNLLTSIIGNISLAQSYLNYGDKAFKLLTRAEEASLRARDLTQRLITFSRGGVPSTKTVHISPLLKNSIEFALSGSNIKHEISVPDGIWPVEIDEAQIGQAIHNLITNAREAMPQGGLIKVLLENIKIDKEKESFLKKGKYVKISIKDEGIGIPKKHMENIFDPYFSTKEMGTQKGVGLGLSICHSIINKHHGHITVESKINIGTNFHTYLPASDKKIVTHKKIEEKPIAHRGRILLMDDEDAVRDTACEMLNHLGYEVKPARDGRDAIDLYAKAKESGHPFDAVILDLTVRGGMGGREAIKELKKIDPEVKGIVTSGYPDDPVLTDFKDYYFRGAIAKPYNSKTLSENIQKVIKE